MARKKLGRNEKCWCGSGKKYKRCHLGRDREQRPQLSEAFEVSKSFFTKKICLHPDAGAAVCEGGIVQAHTIQRNGGLSQIARDGHVVHYKPDLGSLVKTGGSYVPKLVGLKDASTFTGFCGKHDNETFSPIEDDPLFDSPEQAHRIGYRAVCYELYAKMAVLDALPGAKEFDRGLSQSGQQWLHFHVNSQLYGNDLGLLDVKNQKDLYDTSLTSGSYSSVRDALIWLDRCPEIMSTGVHSPVCGFDGSAIQTLTDFADTSRRMDMVGYALLGTDTGGVAAFVWIGKSSHNAKLVNSLLSLGDDMIPHALARFAVSTSENTYFSPSWWDGLSDSERDAIAARLHDEPNVGQDMDRLLDGGLRLVNWTVVDKDVHI